MEWRKATASAGQGACVEIATTSSGVYIRDSKAPTGFELRFTKKEWDAFLAGVKAGEFDLP